MTEQQLVQNIRNKEQWAWKQFYEQFSPSLNAIAIRYLEDRDLAKDVLQNSFVKIFHAVDKFTYLGKGSLGAWATKIVINESLKELRRREKLNFSECIEDFPDILEEDISTENLSQEEIFHLLLELPIGYRTVFNLFIFEEKSHREIADLLGIEENSSASQLHRAKKMLAKKIKAYHQRNPDCL